MAKRVEIVLLDDLDDGVASETVSFAIDGSAFEIDLSDANAESLRGTLAPFVAAGRKVAPSPRRTRRS